MIHRPAPLGAGRFCWDTSEFNSLTRPELASNFVVGALQAAEETRLAAASPIIPAVVHRRRTWRVGRGPIAGGALGGCRAGRGRGLGALAGRDRRCLGRRSSDGRNREYKE